MSECQGPGCTHPECKGTARGMTCAGAYVDEVGSLLDEILGYSRDGEAECKDTGTGMIVEQRIQAAALSYAADKWAAMPRRERRAAMRGQRRRG